MLLMLPVALALLLLRPANATGLALLATAVGSIGMIAAGVLQDLFVFGVVEYQQTITAVLSAGGLIGVWLILTNALALSGEILPA